MHLYASTYAERQLRRLCLKCCVFPSVGCLMFYAFPLVAFTRKLWNNQNEVAKRLQKGTLTPEAAKIRFFGQSKCAPLIIMCGWHSADKNDQHMQYNLAGWKWLFSGECYGCWERLQHKGIANGSVLPGEAGALLSKEGFSTISLAGILLYPSLSTISWLVKKKLLPFGIEWYSLKSTGSQKRLEITKIGACSSSSVFKGLWLA